jgi:hypothetical protein
MSAIKIQRVYGVTGPSRGAHFLWIASGHAG